jgi:hypothetical protein
MKYNLMKDLLDHNNVLSHLFLNCLTKEQLETLASGNNGKTAEEVDARTVEIELTINGISVNPKKFFDLFSDQYDDMVKRAATKLMDEKFRDFSGKMQEMQEVMNAWAEEINWDVPNPFVKQQTTQE